MRVRWVRTSGSRYSGVWVYTPYSRLHFRVDSSRSIAFCTSHFDARRYLGDEAICQLRDHGSESRRSLTRTSAYIRSSRVTVVISISKRRETRASTTHQPEFFLLCEFARLFTRELVSVLGEVFIDLLVHLLLLSRGFWRAGISFRLWRRDGDIIHGGHGKRQQRRRWDGPPTLTPKSAPLGGCTFPRLSSFPVIPLRVAVEVASLRGYMEPGVRRAAENRGVNKNEPETRHRTPSVALL